MGCNTGTVLAVIIVIVLLLLFLPLFACARKGRAGFGSDTGRGRGRETAWFNFGSWVNPYEDDAYAMKEGLHGGGGGHGGGHGGGGHGGGGHGGGHGGGGHGGLAPHHGGHGGRAHWHNFHRGGYRRPSWWNTSFNGRPWSWWWFTDPGYANSLVVSYPGYCDWCALCENLDPGGASNLCANCDANCP